MKYDTIPINKELIPYYFSILLCGEPYVIRIDYNKTFGFFSARLSKDGNVVCSGEKLVYGKPLFEEIYESGKFPPIQIVPFDLSGENNEVTYDNLAETVHLIINNKTDDILEIKEETIDYSGSTKRTYLVDINGVQIVDVYNNNINVLNSKGVPATRTVVFDGTVDQIAKKGTTLGSYGITDTYTKQEIDQMIQNAIIDCGDADVDGESDSGETTDNTV